MGKIKVLYVLFAVILSGSPVCAGPEGYISHLNPSWTWDSKMLVFEEDTIFEKEDKITRNIAARNLETNQESDLTCDCREFAISPDLGHILINRSLIYDCSMPAGLWKFIPDDYLGKDTVVMDAVWSPDSGKIAYVRYNNTSDKSHICIFDLRNKTTKVILKDKFAFGRDGRDVLIWTKNRIIFTTASKSLRGKHEGIVLCSSNPDGTGIQYLPDQDMKIFMNKMAVKINNGPYYQFKEGGKPDVISLMAVDKKGVARLLVPGNGSEPVCSPDLKITAFVMQRKDGSNIWLDNLDKGTFTQLTYEGGEKPVWSTDGKKIAFRRGRDWFVINSNGSNIKKRIDENISEFPGINSNRDKAISPDKKHFAIIKPVTTGNKEYPLWELSVTDKTGAENKSETR
jgi:hypothetical protein